MLYNIGGKHSNNRLIALQNLEVYQAASKNYNTVIQQVQTKTRKAKE